MPSQRRVSWAKFRVSTVCFAALCILLVLFYLLTGGSLLQQKANLYLFVPDATGLSPGSPVRVDGIGVGKVTDVSLMSSPTANRVVRVRFTVVKDRLNSIPVDSSVQFSTDTLIGDKFVDISSGKAAEHVRANSEMHYEAAPELMKSLDLSQFEKQLREMDATLTDIEQGRGLVGQFVQSDDMYRTLLKRISEFQRTVHTIADQNTSLGHALYSDEMYRQMRQPALDLDAQLAQIQSGQGSTGQLFRNTAMYDQWRAAANDMLKSLSSLRANDFMRTDQQYQDWVRLVESLTASVDGMNASPLLNRTDQYESLNGMAKELRDSLKDFREHPKKYLRLKVF